MIQSSCCQSLKLFHYTLNHQGTLSFICSFSLISVSRTLLSLSTLGDLLFSSPRPFDLNLWATVFTSYKDTEKKRLRRFIVFKFCCVAHFSTHIHVIYWQILLCFTWVVISPFNSFTLFLLSYQVFELRRKNTKGTQRRNAVSFFSSSCHYGQDLACILRPELSDTLAFRVLISVPVADPLLVSVSLFIFNLPLWQHPRQSGHKFMDSLAQFLLYVWHSFAGTFANTVT